jgi:hypothetical protein
MASSTAALPADFLAEDRTATMLGVMIFLLVWSTVVVACRVWARGVIIKQLGIDDYICVIALVGAPEPLPALQHDRR